MDRGPSAPVVEIRMSMRGEVAGRGGESGFVVLLKEGRVSGDGLLMFMGVARPEDEGDSILILPIDIFFRNPHLRPPLSLPSFDLNSR